MLYIPALTCVEQPVRFYWLTLSGATASLYIMEFYGSCCADPRSNWQQLNFVDRRIRCNVFT
ncbi:hypothetical protein OH492_19885 [Vibrio chagasii]|nr:hypothetical protein [Vibrio chagasii]